MSVKNKLTKVFEGDTNKVSSSNQSLIQRNAQLSLFYQLEQRKVQKLEEKVQALLLRNQSLLSDNDEERLKLLVADQTKRKLIQLKFVANKMIAALNSGLKEFDNFIKDVDEAIEKETTNGAMPVNPVHDMLRSDLLDPKFNPTLIPESPLLTNLIDISLKTAGNIANLFLQEAIEKSIEMPERNELLKNNEKQLSLNVSKSNDKSLTVEVSKTINDTEETIIENTKNNHKDDFFTSSSSSTSSSIDNTKINNKNANSFKKLTDQLSTEAPTINKSEKCKKKKSLNKSNNQIKTKQCSIIELSETDDSSITFSKPKNLKDKIASPKNAIELSEEKKKKIVSELSELINFEDALTGQFYFNGANLRRESFIDSIKSPSFINFDKKLLRPIFTSTPKQIDDEKSSKSVKINAENNNTKLCSFKLPQLSAKKSSIVSGKEENQKIEKRSDKKIINSENDDLIQNNDNNCFNNITSRRRTTTYDLENSTLKNETKTSSNCNDDKTILDTKQSDTINLSSSLSKTDKIINNNNNNNNINDSIIHSKIKKNNNLFVSPRRPSLRLSRRKTINKKEDVQNLNTNPYLKRNKRQLKNNNENDLLQSEDDDIKLSKRKRSKNSNEQVDQSTTSTTSESNNTSNRQQRAARTKVLNYKPVPLNVKMRREF